MLEALLEAEDAVVGWKAVAVSSQQRVPEAKAEAESRAALVARVAVVTAVWVAMAVAG